MELKDWDVFEPYKNTIYRRYGEFLISIFFERKLANLEFQVEILHDLSNKVVEKVSFDNFFEALKFVEDFLEIE